LTACAKKNIKSRQGGPPVSPRGLVRRVISMHVDEDEDEELRRRAYDERRPVTELVRAAVRAYLGIED